MSTDTILFGKGKIGKVIGALLIIDLILFVILLFTDVIIPYWNGDFPSYRFRAVTD